MKYSVDVLIETNLEKLWEMDTDADDQNAWYTDFIDLLYSKDRDLPAITQDGFKVYLDYGDSEFNDGIYARVCLENEDAPETESDWNQFLQRAEKVKPILISRINSEFIDVLNQALKADSMCQIPDSPFIYRYAETDPGFYVRVDQSGFSFNSVQLKHIDDIDFEDF